MASLIQQLKLPAPPVLAPPSSLPSFTAFDSTSELWKDYWDRFNTFAKANSIPEARLPQVFLTSQSANMYKLLSTLASQQTPPKEVDTLVMTEIKDFMDTQYDHKKYTVRERYRFWSSLQRKPGETMQELAARIRQEATTCDFASITDPLDEAMRTRFICSVNNEAVLKAFSKLQRKS